MATSKLFNIVGVSKLNGEYKVRFATDIMRIKVLAKLDTPVTKYEAVTQLKSLDEFQDAAAQSAIAEYLEDKAPKAPKAKAAPKATKAPAKAKAKATADLEDAPF